MGGQAQEIAAAMEEAWREAGVSLSMQDREALSSVGLENVFASILRGEGRAAAAEGAAPAQEMLDMQAAWGAADNESFNFEQLWESLKQNDTGYEAAWNAALEERAVEYAFQPNNRYLGEADLLQRGTECFHRGDLVEAVLLLEAAVQASPEDSIAWQTLGQAHADSDDDYRAIACLRRAVTADPHNLDALLALGVSYTNELDQTRALQHLQFWLESHPDFVALEPKMDEVAPGAATFNPYIVQQRVTAMFEAAAEQVPADADLHLTLGVLHNLSREYPKAIAAFERALELRPTDYSLWNKLGATQANAMSCQAAVPCYVRALELKPQYVRALTNLGISYGNMSLHMEAAQCYLKALSLNKDASHVWSYLTMTFTSMHRPDLVEKAAHGDFNLFREDIDF